MGIFDSIVNFGSQMITNAQNERHMREAWGREDSAVQRRVADLKAAGLSPVLAAGQGASTMGPVRLEAPQLKGGSLLDAAAGLQQLRSGQLSMDKTRKEIDLMQSQKDRIDSEKRGQDLANAFAESNNPTLLGKGSLELEFQRATKQSRIDQVLRAAEGAGLENTNKRLDNVLKGMEIPEKALGYMRSVLDAQLKREQISGIKAEIAVKAATVDMLAEREKAYTASAGRDRALTELLKEEEKGSRPRGTFGEVLDQIMRFGDRRKK